MERRGELRIKGHLLGGRLASLRHLRGLSRRQLADALGCDEGFVAAVEAGSRVLEAGEVVPYARALGVDACDVWAMVEAVGKEWRDA